MNFRLSLAAIFLTLTACGNDNVNCSAYVGTNLPNDYVTGTCTEGVFTGYQPSTQQKGRGVCDDGGYVSGQLDNGTPFAGSCTES